jgi:hypothetical protein
MQRSLFFWVILGVGLASVASAQPKGPSGKKCQALFTAAIEPYNNSDFTVALPLFEQGFEQCKDSEFLAYAGFSLYKLHRYQDAEKLFISYMEQYKKGKSRATVLSLRDNIPAILQTKITTKSTPTGATIWLDSKVDAPLGQTPLEINVSPGKRTLIAEMDGYARAELIVDIKKGSTTPTEITLIEASSKVSINTEPQGAQVLIDGAAVGVTPFEGKVIPGKHELRIQKEGYGALLYKIEARFGKPFSYNEKLPPPFAVLAISLPADVAGLELSIDGAPADTTATSIQVQGGDHKIVAKAPGYRVFNYSVAAMAGQIHEVNVALKKRGLYVDIQPNTTEAKINTNGKPTPPGELFIPIGKSVDLEVTQEGKLPYRETIDATQDENIKLAIEMSPPKLKRTWRAMGIGATTGALGLGAATFAFFKLRAYNDPNDNIPATIQDFKAIKVSAAVADALLVGTLTASYFTWRFYKREKSGKMGSSKGIITKETPSLSLTAETLAPPKSTQYLSSCCSPPKIIATP